MFSRHDMRRGIESGIVRKKDICAVSRIYYVLDSFFANDFEKIICNADQYEKDF